MKKILMILAIVIGVAIIPSFVSAGFSPEGSDYDLRTILEVSKDGITWLNYNAETNSGDQTLTITPGDIVYVRLKTWNVGDTDANNIQFTSSFTNPQYIDSFDAFNGANDNLDGDEIYYHYEGVDTDTGEFQFSLDQALANTTEESGFQSGAVTMSVDSATPDQAVILVTVQIPTEQATFLDKLLPRVYADSNATTQVRIIVSNPTPERSSDPTQYMGKGQ
jgi:hypothetical protein